MNEVIAIVEGPTERRFVEEILAPWLGASGVFLNARVLGKFGHKGGVKSFRAFREEAAMLLKNKHWRLVTTMIDFYGMPSDWPGRAEADTKKFLDKAGIVEEAWSEALQQELGDRHDAGRFLPYVQMHEFEALLFSRPAVLSELLGSETAYAFLKAREAFSTPEEINDDPVSAPSKRILSIHPPYGKTREGIAIAERIGMEAMLSECPHFRSWIDRLLQLGTQP